MAANARLTVLAGYSDRHLAEAIDEILAWSFDATSPPKTGSLRLIAEVIKQQLPLAQANSAGFYLSLASQTVKEEAAIRWLKSFKEKNDGNA